MSLIYYILFSSCELRRCMWLWLPFTSNPIQLHKLSSLWLLAVTTIAMFRYLSMPTYSHLSLGNNHVNEMFYWCISQKIDCVVLHVSLPCFCNFYIPVNLYDFRHSCQCATTCSHTFCSFLSFILHGFSLPTRHFMQ